MSRFPRGLVSTLLLSGALGLTIAGCGSSTSTKTSSPAGAASTPTATTAAPASTGSSKLKGSPIKLTVISYLNTPDGSEPDPYAGAEGAARAINAAGGIHGHPIVISTCNSQFSPSGELSCAQGAVTGHSTAVVGSLAFIDSPADLAIWQKGGIANVGSLPTVPQDFSSPISFPLYSFLQSVACTTAFPKLSGATKIGAAILDEPIGLAGYKLDAVAAAKSHTSLSDVSIPNSATDMTSYVEQLSTHGANGVLLGLDAVKGPVFIQAAASLGKTWPYCTSDGILTGSQLESLGSAANNLYFGANVPPVTATAQYPGLKKFLANMAAEQASGDAAASTAAKSYSAAMLGAWLGVEAVAQVGDTMTGPINHATFLKAINTAKVSFDGIIPAINFAKPDPVPGFSRLFNPIVLLDKWNPAKQNFYLVPGAKPINALAAIAP